MRLKNKPDLHLTYCTNIHPGESWEEVFEQLKSNVPNLKKRIAPDHSFGIGLRLSAEGATELLQADRLSQFREWLDRESLYVFTMNGFPYGSFHRQRVKDQVYAPDWRTEERVEYTIKLVRILADLLPYGLDGGISTSPLSYKLWLKDEDRDEVYEQASINLARVAWKMAQVMKNEGKELHVDIEPEPDCLLENTEETIAFFQDWLFPRGGRFLSDMHGISSSQAEDTLRKHIRVCYDTCHLAVEYEKPHEALQRFREAGIRIGKTQISAAIKVSFSETSEDRNAVASRLQAFEESTYLHQVIERRSDGSLHHYSDLSEGLPHINSDEAREWRIHYHVPIFIDRFGVLSSTQDDIIEALPLLTEHGECTHFEIETYTWDVLPGELKTNVLESIEREYQWVLGQLNDKV